MKYAMQFLVDVTDDSMNPRLYKGDFVTVCSGVEVDDDHLVAVLVNDDATQTTQLLIRKMISKPGKITLKPLNIAFPTWTFEGEYTKCIRVLGIVTRLHRYFGSNQYPQRIVTARRASDNRMALETKIGNIVCEPLD